MTIRIVLLFPPVSDPCQPYLSLPTLTAFLRSRGYPVVQRDLNVEAFETFLSPERLRAAQASVARQLTALETSPSLAGSAQDHYAILAQAHLTAMSLVEQIGEAKQVLRSPDSFYDFERYRWSIRTLKLAMALISAQYYPTDWGLDHLRTRHTQGKAWSVPHLLETIENEGENPFVEFFRNQVMPSLYSEAPRLVGISITYMSQVVSGLTLARLIKHALPGTHVCVGGAALTDLAGRLERNPDLFRIVDSVITHEGEHAVLALAQQLERGGPLASVPNLLYLENDRVVRNPLGPVEDINALPTPDFDGLPLSLYFSPEPVFLLATSRGCYWKRCAFCTVSTAARSSCYRPRARKLVKKDLQVLVSRYGTRNLFLSEDSVAPGRLRMMAEIVQELDHTIRWECETRLEGLTADLCHQIAEAGCRRLIFGLEAASQRVLDLMDKGTRVETISRVLDRCQSAGIAVNLQSFVGFPGETATEARQTLQFLLEHQDQILSVAFGHFLLQQGSRVEQNPSRYGVTHIAYPPDDMLAVCYDFQVDRGMTPAEATRLRAEGLQEIQKAYGYLSEFHGHDVGPHSFLYLVRYGQDAMRKLPQVEAPAEVASNLCDRVTVVSPKVVCRPYRNGDSGDPSLLVYNSSTGRVIKAGIEIARLLELCDGQASVSQIANRLAGQDHDLTGYLKAYFQALSLAQSCVQNGVLEFC